MCDEKQRIVVIKQRIIIIISYANLILNVYIYIYIWNLFFREFLIARNKIVSISVFRDKDSCHVVASNLIVLLVDV